MTLSHRALVASLCRAIDEALDPLVPRGSRVALLDFPHHNNVGDNAIWLGELAYLRRREVELVYTCDLASYSSRTLRERLGEGIILLHGGGNLGTLWPEHQAFRERIVTEHPDRRIVQLPQTVDFSDRASLERARRVLGGHGGITVLGRDHESVRLLSEELGVPAALCPDTAFALGCLEREPPCREILWLARSDHEAAGQGQPSGLDGVETVDWLVGEPGRPWSYRTFPVTVRLRRGLHAAMRRSSWFRRIAAPAAAAAFEPLAWRRLGRGLRILSRGRVVVTDRLHGHVLCLQLGIPHVLLDNRFGKLERFHRAFTDGCDLGVRAADPAAALELARRLAREAP